MVTADCSPRTMAQKTQAAGISRELTAVPPLALHAPERAGYHAPARPPVQAPARPGSCAPRLAVRRAELEPDAGAGPLAQEAPALGDLVDELETAPALVLPGGLAPVREPAAAVVDDVHVHDRATVHHRDGHPARVGGVLHRVGDEFARQQLGVDGSRVAVQGVPDEAAGGGDLLRPAARRAAARP